MSQRFSFRVRAGMNALRCPLCDNLPHGLGGTANSLMVNLSLMAWARLQVAREAAVQTTCVGQVHGQHTLTITIVPGAGFPGPALLPETLVDGLRPPRQR